MLSIHGSGNEISEGISSDLIRAGAEQVNFSHCLCTYDLPAEIIASKGTELADIVIYHPARDTSPGYMRCWEIHKAVIEANPQQRFYVFARFNPDIMNFLGKKENLKYFADGNTNQVWTELVEMIHAKN
jgi:hypothetical protein